MGYVVLCRIHLKGRDEDGRQVSGKTEVYAAPNTLEGANRLKDHAVRLGYRNVRIVERAESVKKETEPKQRSPRVPSIAS